MPTKPVRKNGRIIGYRWGKSGKLYKTSKYGAKKAENLANRQGRAIKASQTRRSYSSKPTVWIRRKDGVKQRYHVGRSPVKRKRRSGYYFDSEGNAQKKKISKMEIEPLRTTRSKLAMLRDELDFIDETLELEDLPDQRRIALEESRARIAAKLRGTKHQVPYKDVTGKDTIELMSGLEERFKGTTTRKPDFVKYNLSVEATPAEKKARMERLKQKIREDQYFQKSLNVAEDKAIRQATEDNLFDFLSLKDVKRSKRGRPLGWKKKKNFSSLFGSSWHDHIHGGLADNRKPSDFDQVQLNRGKIVEFEHTDDPQIAEEIAMDHLMEHPKYYEYLEEAEKKMKKDKFTIKFPDYLKPDEKNN